MVWKSEIIQKMDETSTVLFGTENRHGKKVPTQESQDIPDFPTTTRLLNHKLACQTLSTGGIFQFYLNGLSRNLTRLQTCHAEHRKNPTAAIVSKEKEGSLRCFNLKRCQQLEMESKQYQLQLVRDHIATRKVLANRKEETDRQRERFLQAE